MVNTDRRRRTRPRDRANGAVMFTAGHEHKAIKICSKILSTKAYTLDIHDEQVPVYFSAFMLRLQKNFSWPFMKKL